MGENQKREGLAQIVRIVNSNSVIISISGDSKSYSTRMKDILFRGNPAPKNLLNKGTEMHYKLKEDNNPEFFLDSKLDIHAVFAQFVLFTSKLEFTDGNYISYDVEFNQVIGLDNKPIAEQSIDLYKNKYALIYFNGDAVIEARLMDESIELKFKLDNFVTNRLGQVETEYIILKDDRLIPYKIHKNFTFYKGKSKNFSSSSVSSLIGIEVKVSIQGGQIFAEVQDQPKENALISRDSSHSRSQDGSQSLNYRRSSQFDPTANPIYGKRSKIQYDWFEKENSVFDNNSILLLGLFEVLFRHPQWPGREFLYQNLQYIIWRKSPNECAIVNQIYGIFRDCSVGQIEKLYKLFQDNSILFSSCAKEIFKEPYNFNLISESYNLIIYTTNESLTDWKTYTPFDISQQYPIIYLKLGQKLGIIYQKQMMEYDGYDCQTLEYIIPQNCDLNLFRPEDPNIYNIFNAVKKVQGKLSKNDRECCEFNNELIRLINILKINANQNELEHIKQIYKELINFNYEEHQGIVKCSYCDDLPAENSCGNHYLCNRCSFISSRIRYCVFCNSDYNYQIKLKNNICQQCKNQFEDIQLFGFKCTCIICIYCLKEIINSNRRLCSLNHEIDDYYLRRASEYLHMLRY